jgi:hypothetical protein
VALKMRARRLPEAVEGLQREDRRAVVPPLRHRDTLSEARSRYRCRVDPSPEVAAVSGRIE